MLYITENEKKRIKSLYYTENLTEQGSVDSAKSFMTPDQYSGYINKETSSLPTKDELLNVYNSAIDRYNVKTSDGIHNLLTDAQLTAAFTTAGVADNYIGILHSVFWFYEGLTVPANDEEKTKKFIMGVIELVLALPGFAELTPLSKYKETIKSQPLVQTIERVNGFLSPVWTKIESAFKTISELLNKTYAFLLERKFDLLAGLCKAIINRFEEITTWFFNMVEYFKKLGGGALKKIESGANIYVSGENLEKVKSGLGNLLDEPSAKSQTSADYSPGNIPMNAQDSTDPRFYQAKVKPTPPVIKNL